MNFLFEKFLERLCNEMFTKTANEFLKTIKTDTIKDIKSPLPLGVGAYMFGSGNMSLGGAVGTTAGMSAANSLYNYASKNYIVPKLEGYASKMTENLTRYGRQSPGRVGQFAAKLPGRLGGAARTLGAVSNGIAGLVLPGIAGGAIGNAVDKYAPIYKRKSF